MSAKQWGIYYGTNPIVRIGGSANSLRGQNSALGSQARGRTALAGGLWAKNHPFAKNIAWDLSLSAFVRRDTRMDLDNFINNQRIDIFGRCLQQPHDLFISNPTDDLEWVALWPETSDIDNESVGVSYPVAALGVVEEICLGDLSMWSQHDPKYGEWSLYNPDNTASYQHQIPGTSTHADFTSETEFMWMGWIRSTGTDATQSIFRKVNQAILSFGSGVLSFAYGGTVGTFSTVTFPMGINRWMFLAIRKPAGTTAEMYYGFEGDTNLSGPFTATVASSPASGGSNVMYIGNNAGNGSFVGYLGPMVFANKVLPVVGPNAVEAEFDLTKVGQVGFTNTADWNATYGVSPTKDMFLDMQRRISFESIDNLMLTKVYNVYTGNATPADGAIVLDHGRYATDDIAYLFAGGIASGERGLGDRLFLGRLSDFTDDVNYSDASEIVYVRRKAVGTVDANQARRIEIKPVGLATDPASGFRANHKNGQSLVRKFAQRWPRTICQEITPEEVDSLARGMLREISYAFAVDSPPFLNNHLQNYSNTLDLWYEVYAP